MEYENKEETHVECHKCGYSWKTKSKKMRVNCSECGTSTKRERYVLLKKEKEIVYKLAKNMIIEEGFEIAGRKKLRKNDEDGVCRSDYVDHS